jgi:hypothetical protein
MKAPKRGSLASLIEICRLNGVDPEAIAFVARGGALAVYALEQANVGPCKRTIFWVGAYY